MQRLKLAVKVLRSALLLLLCLVLLANVALLLLRAVTHDPNKTLFGFSWVTVLSGSMEPALSVDDLVVNQKQSAYMPGDIITFQNSASLTTHRIVKITDIGFVTRGDANNADDAAIVKPQQILGKVVASVPKVGLVIGYLKTPIGMTCLVFILLLLLILPYISNKSTDNSSGGM